MFYKKMVFLMLAVVLLAGCSGWQVLNQESIDRKAASPAMQSIEIKNAENVLSIFIVPPEVVKALVPAPLAPTPYNIMYVVVSRSPFNDGFVHTMELGVSVMYQGKMFNYPVYSVVDNERISELGRAATGMPTRVGLITMEKRDQKIAASVIRDGKTLFKTTLTLTEPGEPLPNVSVVNLKVAGENQKETIKQLVTGKIETAKIHELIDGEATLEFDQSAADGFPKIKVQQIYRSLYRKADFTATSTGVLYDYLQTK